METRRASLIFVAVAVVYFSLMTLNVEDINFILYRSFLTVDFDLPVSGGYISLPGLTQTISTYQFFMAAPLIVVGLHAFGLRLSLVDGDAARPPEALDQLLGAIAIFGPPLLLLGMARAYAPFATIQPLGENGLSRYWLVLLHQGLIVCDWIGLLFAFTLTRGAAIRVGPPGPRSLLDIASVLMAGLGVVLLAFQVADLRGLQRAKVLGDVIPEDVRPAVLVGSLIVAPLLLLAAYGRIAVSQLRWALRRGLPFAIIGAPIGGVLAQGHGSFLIQGRRIPMSLRIAATAFAMLATSQIGYARGIDVSHQQIAVRMPSETIIAAYIERDRVAENGMDAWTAAVFDHAIGVSLESWRLARADFTGAVVPNAQMEGAQLQGATFDFANLVGADLRGIAANGASFRNVKFSIRLAQVGTDGTVPDTSQPTRPNTVSNFKDANLIDADFTEANLQYAEFRKFESEPTSCKDPNFGHPTNMNGLILNNADLFEAYFEGVNFTELGEIGGANFKNAHLRCAVFSCEEHGAINFEGADLRGASFIGAGVSEVPRTRAVPTPCPPQ